jgi:alcohol dehydrogenase class IV
MPYVLARNRKAIEGRLDGLDQTLGIESGGFLDWVATMRADCGIPKTLDALGVRPEHVPVLAPRAAADPSAAGNPIAFGEADYAALYRQALSG